jgi:uncharacterized membrane protein
LAELIVIKPEHPFSGKELFFLAVCLGVLAWVGPFVVDFALARVPGLSYQGSGVERAVKDLGRPVLMGLGAAVLGFCAPTRGWFMAPVVALADVFLWIVRAYLASGQSDLGRIEALGPALLRILALTVLPAAVTGAIVYVVRD